MAEPELVSVNGVPDFSACMGSHVFFVAGAALVRWEFANDTTRDCVFDCASTRLPAADFLPRRGLSPGPDRPGAKKAAVHIVGSAVCALCVRYEQQVYGMTFDQKTLALLSEDFIESVEDSVPVWASHARGNIFAFVLSTQRLKVFEFKYVFEVPVHVEPCPRCFANRPRRPPLSDNPKTRLATDRIK